MEPSSLVRLAFGAPNPLTTKDSADDTSALPRSCSTMFEMAFLQREDFRVLHEPLGEPFYYGPERMSRRFTEERRPEDFKKYAKVTFRDMWADIAELNAEGKFRTFVKDMAQYIIPPLTRTPTTPELPSYRQDGNPTVLSSDFLLHPDVCHAFLIRTPEKTVPTPKSQVTDFDYFEPEEVGIRESRLLYDWLVKQGQKPMLIDAAKLLANPVPTMKAFCDECNVDFTEDMCHWEGGRVQEHFKKWAGFHEDAENSVGIAKPAGSPKDRDISEAQKAKEATEMPNVVQSTIQENMSDYKYLSAQAIS
ncbi:MAG: hypothetical protein CYPHOPRED_001396 [Cyphobasidiales sp. Tagirdzhanova-0007]|nr:MAG: hypothetical protein CYPHOPRED_001396 [Cyphobasidiales sp. Tagirdzhanova-0007]